MGRSVDIASNLRAGGWAGIIAFVLALGVSVALAASLIIIALDPKPVDTDLIAVLTTIAGAAVGAVGTYLGLARATGGSPFAGAQRGQESADPPARDLGHPGAE